MGSLEAAGARLRALRVNAGLTQQQLADKAGISYFTIAKLEQGSTKAPSATVLYKLSNSLGFDIDEFLGRSSSQPSTRIPVKFIYFDIGGVLVHTESVLFHHLSSDLNRPTDRVKAIYYNYVAIACRGKLSLHDLQMLMLLKLNLKYKTAQQHKFFKHWVDYMQPIADTQNFATQLATKYPIGLLTDTIDGFVERMMKQELLPQLNYKAIIKSSDVEVTKPHPEIYQVATQKSGAKPHEILFIDDKKINVKGARKFGWQAEWFNELKPKASIARIRRKYFSA